MLHINLVPCTETIEKVFIAYLLFKMNSSHRQNVSTYPINLTEMSNLSNMTSYRLLYTELNY